MDPLPPKNFRHPTIVSRSIIIDRYKVDDPLGESIFDVQEVNEFPILIERFEFDLSREILWMTDENGNVKISYQVTPLYFVTVSYLSEQLRTQYDLLGAIYTFYNDSLTEERLSNMDMTTALRNSLERIIRRATIRNVPFKFTNYNRQNRLIRNFKLVNNSYQIILF